MNVISGEDPVTGDTRRISAIQVTDENGNIHNLLEVSLNDSPGMVNTGAYTAANLVGGKIVFANNTENRGMDIYNDSTTNTLTFTLMNGTTEVFTFTLQPGQSLINQIYSPFTEIDISGTTPTFRAITRN